MSQAQATATPLPVNTPIPDDSLSSEIEARRASGEHFSLAEALSIVVPLAAQLAAVKHCDMVLGFSMGSTVALEMATTAGFTGPLILTGASFSREAESTMLEVLDALARVTGALPYAQVPTATDQFVWLQPTSERGRHV